jgi:transcription termination/antitermination protein NusG
MSSIWYVLQSKPNKEAFLTQQLEYKQVDHFYPTIKVTPVNPRSRKIRSYFPGYLFVHLDPDQPDQFATLRWMPGAIGLVSFDGRPAEVPDGLIAAVKSHVSEESIAHIKEHLFEPGDKVEVFSGPFEGYAGLFDTRISGTDRVRILIKLLRGYSIKVELPEKIIKKAHEGKK